jgi:hypothetical protein
MVLITKTITQVLEGGLIIMAIFYVNSIKLILI